ncbi:hypothetical protein AB0D46_11690 [Streptomyces sp. NPDC048383]|uniref:hypothetical protein n=1 Tax=Streptomyces sp. NPDC048383 TaxID=3155386 RepID=UPI0034323D9C
MARGHPNGEVRPDRFNPLEPLADVAPSPRLSQVGDTWPLDGRVVGIVAGQDIDMIGVDALRQVILDAGMVPLVIAAAGGVLGGAEPVIVQRTFATARSVEFDALVFAGVPGAGADAYGARDAKAGAPQPPVSDPRVLALLTEAYRHGKALVGLGDAGSLFEAAGILVGEPGVVVTDGAQGMRRLTELLAAHRVWERFPAAV